MLNDSQNPTTASDLVGTVAENIKRIRERRGMSLSELAQRAGIGKSTLSMLESGRGNPGIETLWSIGRALSVPFGQLINPPRPDVRVIRAGGGIEVSAETSDLHVRLLVSSDRRGTFEVYTITLHPGTTHRSGAHFTGVVEHILVTKGRLRLGPQDAPVDIGVGDLATFSADTPHTYEALEPDTQAIQIMDYA